MKSRSVGRPSSYNPDVHPVKARELLAQGHTHRAVIEVFGVHTSTYYEWQDKYPEFADATKRGAEIADDEVVASLHRSATGFMAPDGKYVFPNQTAQIFWLKNRQPGKWKDKQEVEADITLSDASRDEKLELVLSYIKTQL